MYKAFTCVSLVCLLWFVPAAEGKKYAVLISAGAASADDAATNSCFWYNVYLQYTALLEEGYDQDDIHVLYGYGTDFSSSHSCYQPPSPVTDYPVNRANIQSVFSTLSSIMTSNDFLYVWWMGHGAPSGGNLVMSIETTGQSVWDYEIESWVGQITDYDVRAFSWMTCHSGGILDNLEGPRSIVMSSATFYESTYDEWLCDTYHAEFHYPERCAWAWETPCGICGPVDADTDDNGRVSFHEAFTYADANTTYSDPQISDLGGLAAETFLGGCTSQGQLALDRIEYACSSDGEIGVVDCDLNSDDEVIDSVTVTIDSTTEPSGETVLLIETDSASADFRGTIGLNTSDAPGVLHISEGDLVTATYIDEDDGQGGVNVVVTDTAVVDCTLPQISNVQTASVNPRSATVSFDTDEPANGTVRFGLACGALSEVATETGFSSEHAVNLTGLNDETTYFYAVDAEDEAGNMASDDNGGTCYTFTTPDVPDFFTEQFSGDFDLSNQIVAFTPNASPDFYSACHEESMDFPTDPSGGTPLSLSDDWYSLVTLTGGEDVSIYGQAYSSFYVGSNGFITFDAGSGDYDESLEEHFGMRRISALYDDFDPSAGGTISWKQLDNRAVVTWENVPEWGTSNSNSFQVEMFFDGMIRITWLSVDAGDGICGLSAGDGLSPDFYESDLNAYGSCDCLTVTPEQGFSAAGYQGGPFAPECMTYTLANASDLPLDWTAAPGGSWLDVTPAGGTLAPAEFTLVDVCVNSRANTLTPEVYTDMVSFTNTTTGIRQTRGALLTVLELPIEPPLPEAGGPACSASNDCEGAYGGADCVGGTCYVPKNRYLSIDPTVNANPVAYRVEITEARDYPRALGLIWWVDEPTCYDYPSGDPVVPSPESCAGADHFGWVSNLVAGPVSRLWAETTLHVTGCAIVADVTYEIRASDDGGATFSNPLVMGTAHNPEGESQSWGDITGGPVEGMPGAWLPPDRSTNFGDVGNSIRTFENQLADTGHPPRVWVDVEINQTINLADVQFIVNAFEGRVYADIQLELIGVDPADCP